MWWGMQVLRFEPANMYVAHKLSVAAAAAAELHYWHSIAIDE